MNTNNKNTSRKPNWLKIKLHSSDTFAEVKKIVSTHNLHTICQSGNCPNIAECWNAGTATFMILGNICTRSCKFCNVTSGIPKPIDINEPYNVAQSVKKMKLNHCVITSVTRDDLPDGGASLWAQTIKEIKKYNPNTTIETLIPDFGGISENIKKVIDAKPDIISHNVETVKRLTKIVRNKATYETSLSVLKTIKHQGYITKSGIMIGIGETDEEIIETIIDIATTGCDILTIGQYLQPTPNHLPVERYIPPEQFNTYKKLGLEQGIKIIESAPLVRSSYHSELQLLQLTKQHIK